MTRSIPPSSYHRLAVAEDTHFDFDPVQEFLDQDLVVVLERERDRLDELSLVVRLRDPHGRAEACRLHEAREAEWILRRITVAQGDVAGNGNATVA